MAIKLSPLNCIIQQKHKLQNLSLSSFILSILKCYFLQACKIEKYQWGDGYHYIMGCIKRQVMFHFVTGIS
jgi:hypothetical protein